MKLLKKSLKTLACAILTIIGIAVIALSVARYKYHSNPFAGSDIGQLGAPLLKNAVMYLGTGKL